MKKFTFLLILFLTVTTNAQTIGAKGGYTHAHLSVADSDSTLWEESRYVSGFNLGATFEFAQSDHFSCITAIGLTTTGAKGEREEEFNFSAPYPSYAIYHYKLNMVNLEIPFQVKLALNSGDYRFSLALGGYGGLNLFLRSDNRYENKYSLATEHFPGTNYSYGKGSQMHNMDIRRLDYGALSTLGIERGKVSFSASYRYGIANLAMSTMPDGYRIRNSALEFSVGYWFGN